MTARRPAGCDRGSVSVLMVGVIAVVLALAVVLGALARTAAAQAQAQGAADLAALAAARELAQRGASPCPVAQRVASRHQARLVDCRTDGPLVRVEVVVSVPALPGWRSDAHAVARAGPVGLDTPG